MDSQQIAMAQAVHNARVVNAALDSCGAAFDPEIGHKGVVDFSRHEVAESPAPKTPSASKFLPPRPASPPHHPLEWAMTSDEASTADKAAVAELVASSEFSSISELWAGYQAVKRDVQRLRLREKRFESDPLLLRRPLDKCSPHFVQVLTAALQNELAVNRNILRSVNLADHPSFVRLCSVLGDDLHSSDPPHHVKTHLDSLIRAGLLGDVPDAGAGASPESPRAMAGTWRATSPATALASPRPSTASRTARTGTQQVDNLTLEVLSLRERVAFLEACLQVHAPRAKLPAQTKVKRRRGHHRRHHEAKQGDHTSARSLAAGKSFVASPSMLSMTVASPAPTPVRQPSMRSVAGGDVLGRRPSSASIVSAGGHGEATNGHVPASSSQNIIPHAFFAPAGGDAVKVVVLSAAEYECIRLPRKLYSQLNAARETIRQRDKVIAVQMDIERRLRESKTAITLQNLHLTRLAMELLRRHEPKVLHEVLGVPPSGADTPADAHPAIDTFSDDGAPSLAARTGLLFQLLHHGRDGKFDDGGSVGSHTNAGDSVGDDGDSVDCFIEVPKQTLDEQHPALPVTDLDLSKAIGRLRDPLLQHLVLNSAQGLRQLFDVYATAGCVDPVGALSPSGDVSAQPRPGLVPAGKFASLLLEKGIVPHRFTHDVLPLIVHADLRRTWQPAFLIKLLVACGQQPVGYAVAEHDDEQPTPLWGYLGRMSLQPPARTSTPDSDTAAGTGEPAVASPSAAEASPPPQLYMSFPLFCACMALAGLLGYRQLPATAPVRKPKKPLSRFQRDVQVPPPLPPASMSVLALLHRLGVVNPPPPPPPTAEEKGDVDGHPAAAADAPADVVSHQGEQRVDATPGRRRRPPGTAATADVRTPRPSTAPGRRQRPARQPASRPSPSQPAGLSSTTGSRSRKPPASSASHRRVASASARRPSSPATPRRAAKPVTARKLKMPARGPATTPTPTRSVAAYRQPTPGKPSDMPVISSGTPVDPATFALAEEELGRQHPELLDLTHQYHRLLLQMFMYYAKAQTLAGSTPTFSRIATSNTTMTHGGFLMFLKEAGIVPHVLPKAEALKLLVGAPRELAYGTFLKKLLKGAGAALPKIKALPSAPPPSTPIADAVPLVVRVFDNLGREGQTSRVRCRDLFRALVAGVEGTDSVAWEGVAEPVHGLPLRAVFFQALGAGQVPTEALLRGERSARRRLGETDHDEWLSRDELLDALELEVSTQMAKAADRPPANRLKFRPRSADLDAVLAEANVGAGDDRGGEDADVSSARVLLAFIEARLCGQ